MQSSNLTFVNKDFEDKKKSFNNFKLYIDYFKKSQIVIDQNKRKKIIELELLKKSKRKNLSIEINDKLLNEVTDLVNKPNILVCKFKATEQSHISAWPKQCAQRFVTPAVWSPTALHSTPEFVLHSRHTQPDTPSHLLHPSPRAPA